MWPLVCMPAQGKGDWIGNPGSSRFSMQLLEDSVQIVSSAHWQILFYHFFGLKEKAVRPQVTVWCLYRLYVDSIPIQF